MKYFHIMVSHFTEKLLAEVNRNGQCLISSFMLACSSKQLVLKINISNATISTSSLFLGSLDRQRNLY